jgi:hypothetical protein
MKPPLQLTFLAQLGNGAVLYGLESWTLRLLLLVLSDDCKKCDYRYPA